MDKFNITTENAVNIAGGIFNDSFNLPNIKIDADGSILNISALSSDYCIRRKLYLTEYKAHNAFFQIYRNKGNGNGLRAFINQVNELEKLGYSDITTFAISGDDDFNGGYTWARFGYEIDTFEDKVKFRMLLMRNGRKEQSLIELLSTPDGVEFWRRNAMDFHGVFQIHKESENMKALRRYIIEKKQQ